MGNMLKTLWKIPVVKHAIKNKILLQSQFVFNKMVKEFVTAEESSEQWQTLSGSIKELTYPFRDDFHVLYHKKGNSDVWQELQEALNYKIKNTVKLEMMIDKNLILKLKPLNKFLVPPEGMTIEEAFAFTLGPGHYYILAHQTSDPFVRQMFKNFYYQFALLAHSLSAKIEKNNLSRQIQKLKADLLESSDKILEVEKNLKKRLHEIDQIFQVSNELFTIHDREGLINTSLLTLVGQLGCDRAFILLKNEKEGDFSEFYSKGFGIEQNVFKIEPAHPLIAYFEAGGEILYQDEIKFKGEMAALEPFFKETNARMVAPVLANERLIGIMVCGEKLFGGSYDLIDRRIFKVLSNTINLAFTNLHIYEQAAGKAFVDKNTGIANKKYFEKRVQEEKSRILRQNSSLGLLSIRLKNQESLEKLDSNQLNRFDRLLVQQISPVVRTEDFLAYIEPGSLVLLMPGITEETIQVAVNRFKDQLAGLKLPDDLPLKDLELDFNFVIYPEQEEEFEKIVASLIEEEEQPEEGEKFFSDFDFGL